MKTLTTQEEFEAVLGLAEEGDQVVALAIEDIEDPDKRIVAAANAARLLFEEDTARGMLAPLGGALRLAMTLYRVEVMPGWAKAQGVDPDEYLAEVRTLAEVEPSRAVAMSYVLGDYKGAFELLAEELAADIISNEAVVAAVAEYLAEDDEEVA